MTPGDIGVSGGLAREQTPTGTSSDGNYFSGRTYQDPLGTSLHWAEVTHGNTSGASWFPRASGAGVGGSDVAFTSGVLALGSAFSYGNPGQEGTQILTKVGGVLTVRATATVGWVTGDRLRLVITHNGTNYVYTVFKNTSTQIVQWIDTGNIISPGTWVTPACGCSWNSNTHYPSQGMTAFACGDS